MRNEARQLIRIYNDMVMDSYGVYIVSDTLTERKVATFRFEPIEEGAAMPPPCLFLHQDAVQTLMDDLWRIGIRPTEGEGSIGATEARKEHLADLRTMLSMAIRRLPVSDIGKSDD